MVPVLSPSLLGGGKYTTPRLHPPPPLKLSNVTGQKNLALQVPLVVRYKTLEKFSKALYGTTEGTCSARFFRPVMDRGEIISNLG